MSAELQPLDKGYRCLTDQEKILLERMTKKCAPLINLQINNAVVKDMDDGEMGGIQFKSPDTGPRQLGAKCAEAEYTDIDGVLVKIFLNLDGNNKLFELDFWKVDFTKLKKYPEPAQIVICDPQSKNQAE